MVTVRPETAADQEAIRQVHCRAFGQEAEALLVEALRGLEAFVPALSLVAEQNGAVVGHVLFSVVTIATVEGSAPRDPLLGLGPVGVLPECQRQGIGSALIRE